MTATYRWWGSVDPRGRTKLPILASTPVVDGDPWTLQLYEPIDSWGDVWGTSASEFARALAQVPPDAELTIRFNSPGGEVSEAVAMANMIRSRPGPTRGLVDGLAASAASYVAVVVDQLTMGQDSELMIHDPWGITIGPEAEHLANAARLGSVADTLAAAYQRKAGGDVESWRAVMREERWYSAAEAVDAGLADGVAGAGDGEDGAVEELPAAASALRLVYAGILGRPVPLRAALRGVPQLLAPAAAVPPVTPPPAPPAPEPPAPDPAPVVDLVSLWAGVSSALERSTK